MKAVRVLLPGPRDVVLKQVKLVYPGAKNDSSGMIDLMTQISDVLGGAETTISMDYVDTSQVTPFQLHVLKAERSIPRGKAASYAWLARKAGTKAIRAAGSALARNPFPIVVPCHRAVRSTRHIGQYQGGPEMKRRLLEMESVEFDGIGRVHPDCFLR